MYTSSMATLRSLGAEIAIETILSIGILGRALWLSLWCSMFTKFETPLRGFVMK